MISLIQSRAPKGRQAHGKGWEIARCLRNEKLGSFRIFFYLSSKINGFQPRFFGGHLHPGQITQPLCQVINNVMHVAVFRAFLAPLVFGAHPNTGHAHVGGRL